MSAATLSRTNSEAPIPSAPADDSRDDFEDHWQPLGPLIRRVRDGLSLREAAKKKGVGKSSVHRALVVPAVSQTAERYCQGH